MATPPYDLFFSYAHADRATAEAVVERLRALGLRVWFDVAGIETFGRVTRSIQDGLAHSKALVALYSDTYLTRRACQWELTAAFLTAQHEGCPARRVLIINPEDHAEHIHPIELRDALFVQISEDTTSLEDCAAKVQAHVTSLKGTLKAIRHLPAPPVYGILHPRSSPRFVGRLREMWQIHSALCAQGSAVISGQSQPDAALLSGMGGNGKSLLAEEYALQFGTAYPGGIFWLAAYGNDARDLGPLTRGFELQDQWRQIAHSLEIPAEGLNSTRVKRAVEEALEARGEPCLWILDDVPNGVSREELDGWLPGTSLAKPLITTRSTEYRGSTAGWIHLSVLEELDAIALFRKRLPADADGDLVRAIVSELGCHALAIDVAAAYAEEELRDGRTLADVLTDIQHPTLEPLELDLELREQLPNGHEKSIVGTLRRSIERLCTEGLDLLRVCACLALAPISVDLARQILQRADGLDEEEAGRRTRRGRRASEQRSLLVLDQAGSGSYSIHGLVRRTIHAIDAAPERHTQLRAAAAKVLAARLSVLDDGRAPGPLASIAVHAREVSALSDDLTTATLLLWLALYEFRQGEFSAASTHSRTACEIRTRILSECDPETLSARLNLAMALCALGELEEARPHQEAVLEASVQLLGENDPATLIARLQLASTLHALEDYQNARAHQTLVLNGYRAIFGEGHKSTLAARGNLAMTLRALGELDDARAHQQAVLEGSLRLFGDDHPSTLTPRIELGHTLYLLNDFAGAEIQQAAALELAVGVFGAHHPSTTAAAWGLWNTLRCVGEVDSAERILEEHLRWLLSEPTDELGAEQRAVRAYLAGMLANHPATD